MDQNRGPRKNKETEALSHIEKAFEVAFERW